MKIYPSNKFIREIVRNYGEAILVLGTRKAESQRRQRNMEKLEQARSRRFAEPRERLTPNAKLPNSLVYTPIEDWSNDDVWLFLMQVKNPWGHTNKSLLTMYQGASEDGECPLVLDSSTPSCGDSRFGCWTCTVVDKDRSMEAMIKNDEEKVWMTPLLELRNELGDFGKDRGRRDYRRMNGRVQLFHDSNIPGPYTKKTREHWLRRVLTAQMDVRRLGPPDVQEIELVSLAELQEIRRIWLYEKHQFDDSVPTIYEEVTGQPFPKGSFRRRPAAAGRLGPAGGGLRRGRGVLRVPDATPGHRAGVPRDDPPGRDFRNAGRTLPRLPIRRGTGGGGNTHGRGGSPPRSGWAEPCFGQRTAGHAPQCRGRGRSGGGINDLITKAAKARKKDQSWTAGCQFVVLFFAISFFRAFVIPFRALSRQDPILLIKSAR